MEQAWRRVSLEEGPPVCSMCACWRTLMWLSLPSLLFILAVLLPAPLPGCSCWRAETSAMGFSPVGSLGIQTATLMAVPKTSLSSLSLHQFILIQTNKAVKSRSQLYNTNTLQLPCIHTNVKRLEPSYFLYKLDITQLWSRYHFLSETFWPKITIPLSQLNVFMETHHQHFTAHLKNRCLQPIK